MRFMILSLFIQGKDISLQLSQSSFFVFQHFSLNRPLAFSAKVYA